MRISLSYAYSQKLRHITTIHYMGVVVSQRHHLRQPRRWQGYRQHSAGNGIGDVAQGREVRGAHGVRSNA